MIVTLVWADGVRERRQFAGELPEGMTPWWSAVQIADPRDPVGALFDPPKTDDFRELAEYSRQFEDLHEVVVPTVRFHRRERWDDDSGEVVVEYVNEHEKRYP